MRSVFIFIAAAIISLSALAAEEIKSKKQDGEDAAKESRIIFGSIGIEEGYDACGEPIVYNTYRSASLTRPVQVYLNIKVVNDMGHIHEHASAASASIRRLLFNEPLIADKYINGWYRVHAKDSVSGWVRCIFLR